MLFMNDKHKQQEQVNPEAAATRLIQAVMAVEIVLRSRVILSVSTIQIFRLTPRQHVSYLEMASRQSVTTGILTSRLSRGLTILRA